MKFAIKFWIIVLFILISLEMLLFSCGVNHNNNDHINIKYRGSGNDEFYIVQIDSCEYIVFSGTYKGCIIHKQNCKNHK